MIPKAMFQKAYALLLLVVISCPVWAETDQERAEALFQEGYILYQRHYGPVAFPPLKKAAELGHAEAAYYAGEVLRRNHTFITEEAEQFYRQAAEGGDVYAMLRLARDGNFCGTLRDCDYDHDEWIDRALEAALPRAEAGDLDAMKAVYSIYRVAGDRDEAWDWIQQAAEGGHAFSQYWMAILLDEQGMGFYWTEEGRREDILKWLRASAEQGFPPAMRKLAVTLREQQQFEEGQRWIKAMAQTDYYDALVEAGGQIMMGPDIGEVLSPDISYHFTQPRPVEGAALLLALHRQTGKDMPMKLIEAYRDHLTPEMMEEAEARSEELLVDTPIIYYLPKFGI